MSIIPVVIDKNTAQILLIGFKEILKEEEELAKNAE